MHLIRENKWHVSDRVAKSRLTQLLIAWCEMANSKVYPFKETI